MKCIRAICTDAFFKEENEASLVQHERFVQKNALFCY